MTQFAKYEKCLKLVILINHAIKCIYSNSFYIWALFDTKNTEIHLYDLKK